jgi:hypothetical protein
MAGSVGCEVTPTSMPLPFGNGPALFRDPTIRIFRCEKDTGIRIANGLNKTLNITEPDNRSDFYSI